ncbi:MogA/MoaB family molybdenum cofactor biosynthesis protein [Haloferax mucosum]|uniref:MogA/MoaB family molybdenum cofactor biosynthesis protein n=1 Tax=Haloferax mucosum TaxID=403181 RepID=UPI000677C340|nr:molybdenum cofactor synthesis domain-containing protein [Haloferax mucosum]
MSDHEDHGNHDAHGDRDTHDDDGDNGDHDDNNDDSDRNHRHSHDDHIHGHDDHHQHHEHDVEALDIAVLTVSSTRDVEDDPAGDAIKTTLTEAGHSVSVRRVVDDDYDELQTVISRMADRGDVDVTVTTGGTGVTPDDETVEAATQLFDKTLPGFGELFRHLSFDEIGTRVVGTRATAGIVDDTPTFCLPGSENAARLGTAEIIVAEAPHLAGLARRDDP